MAGKNCAAFFAELKITLQQAAARQRSPLLIDILEE